MRHCRTPPKPSPHAPQNPPTNLPGAPVSRPATPCTPRHSTGGKDMPLWRAALPNPRHDAAAARKERGASCPHGRRRDRFGGGFSIPRAQNKTECSSISGIVFEFPFSISTSCTALSCALFPSRPYFHHWQPPRPRAQFPPIFRSHLSPFADLHRCSSA